MGNVENTSPRAMKVAQLLLWLMVLGPSIGAVIFLVFAFQLLNRYLVPVAQWFAITGIVLNSLGLLVAIVDSLGSRSAIGTGITARFTAHRLSWNQLFGATLVGVVVSILVYIYITVY
jgi:hypothetical protein